MKRVLAVLSVLSGVLSVCGVEVRFVGYCGNSGTEEEPVLFGEFAKGDVHGEQTQVGPYVDEARGLMYASAGDRLNVYAMDGRLVKWHEIGKGYFRRRGEGLVRVGERLYFHRNGGMWGIDLGAESGSAAEREACSVKQIQAISGSAWEGEIAMLDRDGGIWMWNASTTEARKVCEWSASREVSMDWNPVGVLCLFAGKEVYQLKNGVVGPAKEMISRGVPVLNCAFAGDAFYGTSYGGSVLRINAETLELDPGVVWGGSGGHTVGKLLFDNDMGIGSRLTPLGNGYFVMGGVRGALLVLQWNEELRRFERIRRVGATPENPVLNVSHDGIILTGGVTYRWSDAEDAPTAASRRLVGPSLSARVGADVVTMGVSAGWPAIEVGTFDHSFTRPWLRQQGKWHFSDRSVGAACGKGRMLYVMDGDGVCRRYKLTFDAHRMSLENEEEVEVRTSRPLKKVRDMVPVSEELFVILDAGEVLFVRPGERGLDEVSRWTTTVAEESRLAADEAHIVLSEREHDRVRMFDLAGGEVAEWSVSAPGAVAINGSRVVVHDTQNQRIAKYEIE